MARVTIISSFHKEMGKCNSDELIKILDQLKPDVLFDELDEKTFKEVFSWFGKPKTVESLAVKKFIKKNKARHYPVDTYNFSFDQLFSMSNLFNRRDYIHLLNIHLENISIKGFKYLNSDEVCKVLDQLHALEGYILDENGLGRAIREYYNEEEIHHKREGVMIQNILSIYDQKPFDHGVFICGVQHRVPLLKKIELLPINQKDKIDWEFFTY
ncbi:hypothetical protein [Flammeovirga sp. EKP202]|uniref:hypothetical protein n=1 Tax=Flammeovirga sp. EKP202 TaxID=2770592 RepID=UPI00165F5EF7|nr:hypothetical protein [Flammeovirga sp. EKP202]MBD0404406.1 hypothetical protein [Flammeovirga sp. EKP202]